MSPLVKYSFYKSKINNCLDCPCLISDRIDWDVYCGLNDKKINSISCEIPDWCELEEGKEGAGSLLGSIPPLS